MSTIEKLKAKFNEKPIPNNISFDEVERLAKAYGCGVVQITASDMGVLLYSDYGFVKNGNFMQYKL